MSPSRTNPLPRGVYRVDFSPELAPVFGRWRRAQKGKVHVLALEESPVGGARVSFVVFGTPGAFPFGKLGYPEKGHIVGAMPDWTDVVSAFFNPLAAVEAFLARNIGELLADSSKPELQALREAIAQVRINIATITRDVESVRNGTAPNPAAVLGEAARLVKESTELLLRTAGAIPYDFPRNVVNELLRRLHELAEAIRTAPARALHSATEFGKKAATGAKAAFWDLVVPYELGTLGLVVLAGGAFLAWKDRKVTDLARNIMLAGAGLTLVGGGTVANNLIHAGDKHK